MLLGIWKIRYLGTLRSYSIHLTNIAPIFSEAATPTETGYDNRRTLTDGRASSTDHLPAFSIQTISSLISNFLSFKVADK